MPDWFRNDELFRAELEAGHRWAGVVVAALSNEGLDADLMPMIWRNDIDDRYRFTEECDIVVATMRGDVVLEAKSRRLAFDAEPSSYPYKTALVDTVSGWDAKRETPRAVVIVSQLTSAMLVVPVRKSREAWSIKSTRDRIRNIDDRWYECPRRSLATFQSLVEWLIGRSQPDRVESGGDGLSEMESDVGEEALDEPQP